MATLMNKIQIRIPKVSLLASAAIAAAEDEDELTGVQIEEEADNDNELIDAFTVSEEEVDSVLSQLDKQNPQQNNKQEEESDEKENVSTTETQSSSEQSNDTQKEDENDKDNDEQVEQDIKNDEKTNNEWDILLEPIKAAGREVKIRNPEHAKALIQMGVDYNKKMQGIKPYIPIMKTLEKNNLLDPQKVNLAIELLNGNPEAVKAIMAQHNIDPMGLVDADESANYQPQDHIISQQELQLQEVLEGIASTPTYDDTMKLVTEVFDDQSREKIAQEPIIIEKLNADISSGVASTVLGEMQYLGDIGKRPYGISDIDWYIQVATSMSEQSQQETQQPQQVVQQQLMQQKQQGRAKQDQRRTAMSQSNSSSGGSATKKQYDVLSMSSEQVDKLAQELGLTI